MKRTYTILLLILALLALGGCGDTMDPGREISLGRSTEGVYTNQYAGIGCEFGSGWVVRDAWALQELPEDMEQQLQDSRSDMEFYPYLPVLDARDEAAGRYVHIRYTKLELASLPIFKSMGDDAVVEQVLELQEELREEFRDVEILTMEKVPVTFLGEEHVGLKIHGQTQDRELWILQLYNYRLGGYGVDLTVATAGEDAVEALLSLFRSLE